MVKSVDKALFTEEVFDKKQFFYSHTTVKIGGKIRYYFEPSSLSKLIKAISFAINNSIPYIVIGCGSNLLCSDDGFNGLVICMKKLNKVVINGNKVRVYSGVRLPVLVRKCLDNSLSGLEALCGIPGTVGGATVMNAGSFSETISSCIEKVTFLEGVTKKTLPKKDCEFLYRDSIFKKRNLTVLYVDFVLNKSDKNSIKERINEYSSLRNESQPKGLSFGCAFKNPLGYTAGRLIDSVGLKNEKVGGAFVSKKHANFIINDGTASAKDVVKLIKIIKKKVKTIFGITLKEEFEYVGNFDDIDF